MRGSPFWAEGAELLSTPRAMGQVRWHQWALEVVLVVGAGSPGEPRGMDRSAEMCEEEYVEKGAKL